MLLMDLRTNVFGFIKALILKLRDSSVSMYSYG